MKDKKVIFMGTPDFSVPVLEMLIASTNVVLVVTQPDKMVGRKQELIYSPVKKVALENNIPVFQPSRIKKDYSKLKELDIDLIVTCAYGQIVPKEVLDMPKYGCINVHASILPKYRGSAPIQWALFNGENKTGVTIMYMDEGVDTGDIITFSEIPILAEDNVATLHDKLSVLGADTLKLCLPEILNGTAKREPQPTNFSLAPMIKREDERLDFNNTGIQIINKIRGLNPWPLANIVINDLEIKILQASFISKDKTIPGKIEIDKKSFKIECLDGYIDLQIVKPSGKKVMDIVAFINGLNKDSYNNMVIENGK